MQIDFFFFFDLSLSLSVSLSLFSLCLISHSFFLRGFVTVRLDSCATNTLVNNFAHK